MLFDHHGTIREQISTSVEITEYHDYEYSSYVVSSTCKVTKTLEDGDMIALVAKDASSGEWIPIRQSRVGKIVFTKEPLVKLIEIGYVDNPIRDLPGRKSDFYLKSYKDCCWELLGETPYGYGTILNNTNSFFMENYAHSFRYYMSDDGYDIDIDFDCETLVFEIWVPTGSYILRVRNPLTNEQMDITLEL